MRQHSRPIAGVVWLLAFVIFSTQTANATEHVRTRPGDPSRATTSPPAAIQPPLRREGTVNINAATPEDLTRHLKGVGPVKARAIVSYREQHGPFRAVSELADVKGIGQKTVERLRPLIRLE